MSNSQKEYISSRQSPYIFPYTHKYKKGLYANMLFEDFSQWFSLTFSPIDKSSGFYNISPADDMLKKLLHFRNPSNFEHQFDKLLSEIVCTLLINGKAYAEIISFADQAGGIKGLELICIPAKSHRVRRSNCTLTARDSKEKSIKFNIDLDRLIIFDLKDLGFHRNHFRKIANHLSAFEISNDTKLMSDPKMKKIFDYKEYRKSIDYKFLKDTRSIYWFGRDYSNQHLSESYHLYREMQYKILQYKFLNYILSQINTALDNFKEEWGFKGKITADVSLSHYENAFIRYGKGEINASQLGDIVIKNLMPKEGES